MRVSERLRERERQTDGQTETDELTCKHIHRKTDIHDRRRNWRQHSTDTACSARHTSNRKLSTKRKLTAAIITGSIRRAKLMLTFAQITTMIQLCSRVWPQVHFSACFTFSPKPLDKLSISMVKSSKSLRITRQPPNSADIFLNLVCNGVLPWPPRNMSM